MRWRGDHSVVLAELRAAAEKHGALFLVLFDSHPDAWESYFGHRYFHGTPFRRAVEEGLLAGAFEVGRPARAAFNRDDWQNARARGFETVAAGEMHRGGLADLPARILERAGDRPVFLSL